MKYALRPAARDGLLRRFRYYLMEDAPDAALRFLEAVDKAIQQVSA